MLKDFLKSNEDGCFYPGHASALIRINKKLILCDPIWNENPVAPYWRFEPEQYDCDEIIDKVDLCIVSHIHADHFSPRILSKLRCPVLIASGRPQLKDMMDRYAKTVIEFQPLCWHNVLGISLYFVPHSFNSIDSSCFIAGDNYCVYAGNDNFLEKELIAKIAPYIPHIDVAFVPFQFIHWFPACMDMPLEEKEKEIKRLNEQSLDQARMFIRQFHPYITIPCGGNLIHTSNEFLNSHLAKPSDLILGVPLKAGDYVLGTKRFLYSPPSRNEKLCNLQEKVSKSTTRVVGHQIVVNWLLIDLEELTVSMEMPTKDYTEFCFEVAEFEKWFSGQISFDTAISTRQFVCRRKPNIYNPAVFDWMYRWL